MYDHATALGEAALLSARVRSTSGDRVLVPESLREEHREVLDNYVRGADVAVESYPAQGGNADLAGLEASMAGDVSMVYVENPNDAGAIEESVPEIAALAAETDALAVLGSDPVALSLLSEPAAAGIDVVVGDAATLGLGTAFGMGLGLFACREEHLRQVPGRLVGASEDARSKRAYTLTLQTREQHIRRERATSNICTNQAWVALRAAIHAASLGPDGLLDLAKRCVELPREVADRLDEVPGVRAPIHDRHHFREFRARTDQPAPAIAGNLAEEGLLVHAVGEHELQVCVTETNEDEIGDLVAAMEGAA
jgi:glycine dehydrogenase subunit 1